MLIGDGWNVYLKCFRLNESLLVQLSQTSWRILWLYFLQLLYMWLNGSELQSDAAEGEGEEQQSRLTQQLKSRTAQVRTRKHHLTQMMTGPCVWLQSVWVMVKWMNIAAAFFVFSAAGCRNRNAHHATLWNVWVSRSWTEASPHTERKKQR